MKISSLVNVIFIKCFGLFNQDLIPFTLSVEDSPICSWYEVNSNNIHRYDRYRAIRITSEKMKTLLEKNRTGFGKSRVRRNPKSYSFHIGTEESCSKTEKLVCNGPLKSGASYR